MGVSICLNKDLNFSVFRINFGKKQKQRWVSATFGILIPRNTARVPALAGPAATVTVWSANTASTCAVNAFINTPRILVSRRWIRDPLRNAAEMTHGARRSHLTRALGVDRRSPGEAWTTSSHSIPAHPSCDTRSVGINSLPHVSLLLISFPNLREIMEDFLDR